MKVSIDTNCIISLFHDSDDIHGPMQCINGFFQQGKISLFVSIKALDELKEEKPREFALTLPKLPSYPISKWGEQVGSWCATNGSWKEASQVEDVHRYVKCVLSAKMGLRDRQIVFDSIYGNMDALLTRDKKILSERSSGLLGESFHLKVYSPIEFVELLSA
ncbi:MAG TPA: hypothetical protein PKJ16_01545 [Spirochaetota bacterium]|nr:hypothetical protein [Spirochaetota bacterium]HOS38247.1 hypothetical protein [Spirochaetota bacterium]HPU87801.1 hypothetical protein [Spirochaetota bacterium]